MLEVEYLTDKKGQQKAVVLPIELWRQLFPRQNGTFEELSKAVEDYCLNKAMDEAQNTPLMNGKEAMAYFSSAQVLLGHRYREAPLHTGKQSFSSKGSQAGAWEPEKK